MDYAAGSLEGEEGEIFGQVEKLKEKQENGLGVQQQVGLGKVRKQEYLMSYMSSCN